MQSRHTSGQRRSVGPWLAWQGKTCGNSKPLYHACMLGVTGKRLPAPEGLSLSTTLAQLSLTQQWQEHGISKPFSCQIFQAIAPRMELGDCTHRHASLETVQTLKKLYRPVLGMLRQATWR